MKQELLQFMENYKEPLDFGVIINKFNIDKSRKGELKDLLNQLVRDNLLYLTSEKKYILVNYIPMKDRVLDLMKNVHGAKSIQNICNDLNLKTDMERLELEKVIDELVLDTILYSTKASGGFILIDNVSTFRKGKLVVNANGNGFVDFDETGEPSIFIPREHLKYALNGDTVLVDIVREEKDKNGKSLKREGSIVKIIDRDLHNIVGEIKSDKHGLYFEPDKNLKLSLSIDKKSFEGVVEGQKVVVKVLSDLGKNHYTAEIAQVLGHKDDPATDILVVAALHDIFAPFPEEVQMQLDTVPTEVSEKDKDGRTDLRDKMIFTIDGKDTKDIDDAISLDFKDGYYHLGVHIADVSYYVTKDSALDKEAYVRGTSSYLADSVIPMLPHKLSNGICSLNEGVERCALTCDMKIDSRGEVVDYEIYPSVIKSNKKMNYDSVNHLLIDNVIDEGYEPYADTLKQMMELAHILRANKERRGYIDFNIPEAKIICDENHFPIEIKRRTQLEGEKLIEDFMIAANETVAKHFTYCQMPSIYRIHDVPKEDKIAKFITVANLLGCKIVGKFNSMNPKMMQKLMSQIDTEKNNPVLNSILLRSMAKAHYSKENIGHFGLGSKCYTHFTSPIRRYPDLQVHRLLRTYFFTNHMDEQTVNFWDGVLDEIAKQCSDREIAAVDAEREVDKMKMAEYMERHIGEEFDGIISGVSKSRMFVQLDNLVEGAIGYETLKGDYYVLTDDECSVMGKNTKKTYTLGDKIHIKVVAASKVASTIDFEMCKELKDINVNDKQKVRVLSKGE